jgi:uncharacterized protein (TIGR00299 family) protein
MRLLHFDAFSGISGDMTVGALLSLGVELESIEQELAQLPVGGYTLAVRERHASGIRACKFDVRVQQVATSHHAHTAFSEIRSMLQTSGIRPAVKERSLAIFTKLAEAEGRVHGVAPDDVTFHEVGAVDSMVDIVASAVGLADLGIDRLFVSTLPMGSGTVASQHGFLPVPAPATVELLRGFPVRLADGQGELVTPTGAAIVAALAEAGMLPPPLSIEAVGYGAGTRDLPDRPNLLRAILGTEARPCVVDEMTIVETNIDDSSPEIYDYVMERLFEAGARDVWLTPIQMKKNRPGTLLRVLVESGAAQAAAAIILRETSAIGVRSFAVRRIALERQQLTVSTRFGPVAVKRSVALDGSSNFAPEYEDCKRLARQHNVPLKTVYDAALAAALSAN